MIVLPRANHDLGISETGELQSKWRGYAPGALKTMTDWAHAVLHDPSQIDTMRQEGTGREAGILSRYATYERLRWYGNATVQVAHWILFFAVFLINTIIVVWRSLARGSKTALPEAGWPGRLKHALFVLNFVILIALTITILKVIDQLRPSCPSVLLYLPLLGTVSTVATVVFLTLLATTRRAADVTVARRLRNAFDTFALMLFVPYLFYWNLIGVHL